MKYKYHDVAQQAMELAYANGGRLPSERQLCELCSTSRITAKKALNYLREKGMVARHVGKGSYIADGVTAPKVKFMIVKPVIPEPMKEFLRNEAELFFGDATHSEIEFVDIDELVLRAVQGTGTKIVLWHYSGQLGNYGVFTNLNELQGFAELGKSVFTSHGDLCTDIHGREGRITLPFEFSTEALAYNRRIAAELGLDAEKGPSSWEEILEWARKCNEQTDIAPAVFYSGVKQALPYSYYFNAAAGKPLLERKDDDLKFNFTGGRQWLEFFNEIYNMPRTIRNAHSENDPFFCGKALFRLNTSCWIIDVKRQGRLGDISYIPVPSSKKGGKRFPYISRNCLSIVHGGDDEGVNVAWAFCKHLLGNDAQRRLINSFACISANRHIQKEQKRLEDWQVFINDFEQGFSPPAHPLDFGINVLVRDCFESCLAGKITAGEAITRADEISKMLIKIEEERSWL